MRTFLQKLKDLAGHQPSGGFWECFGLTIEVKCASDKSKVKSKNAKRQCKIQNGLNTVREDSLGEILVSFGVLGLGFSRCEHLQKLQHSSTGQ